MNMPRASHAPAPDKVWFGVFITPAHMIVTATDENDLPLNEPIRLPNSGVTTWDRQLDTAAHIITTMRGRLRTVDQAVPALAGVGVAIAGRVDPTGTTIDQASQLHSWVGMPIVPTLRQYLGDVPVVLANDAETRTRWLIAHELSPEVASMPLFGLFCGAGIGGAYASNGQVFSLEPGHVRVPGIEDSQMLLCHCGQRGCLDAHVAQPRIVPLSERIGYAGMTAAVVGQLLEQHPASTIVVGGSRYHDHPPFRVALTSQLQALPGVERVIVTNLAYAPAYTAGVLRPDHGLVAA